MLFNKVYAEVTKGVTVTGNDSAALEAKQKQIWSDWVARQKQKAGVSYADGWAAPVESPLRQAPWAGSAGREAPRHPARSPFVNSSASATTRPGRSRAGSPFVPLERGPNALLSIEAAGPPSLGKTVCVEEQQPRTLQTGRPDGVSRPRETRPAAGQGATASCCTRSCSSVMNGGGWPAEANTRSPERTSSMARNTVTKPLTPFLQQKLVHHRQDTTGRMLLKNQH